MQDWLGQLDGLWPIAGLLLGFSFLIFVHELGHYAVAKWVGIKVTQFAIGFGPGVLAWRQGIGLRHGSTEPEYEKRLANGVSPESMGETEYRLNWFPLGGYVKMHGQDDLDPQAAQAQDERSFSAKPIWARACVVSAGVVMNLIFGALLFAVAFMAGVEFPPPVAGIIMPDSPAATTFASGREGNLAYQGLRTGDRITHIDGKEVTDFADVAVNTALAGAGQTLRLTVVRESETSPLEFSIRPKMDLTTGILALGIERPISLDLVEPAKGSKGLPKILTDAGVKPGMTAVRVDGRPIRHYPELEMAVAAGRGRPVTVTFADPAGVPAANVALSAVPAMSVGADDSGNMLGLVPAIRIPAVVAGSPAQEAGVRPGDVLVQIGPVAWPTWKEVVQVVEQAQSRPIDIAVWRENEVIELPPIQANFNGKIGIYQGPALDQNIVTRVLPSSPLASLQLNAGSRILAVNGQPVATFADIQRSLADAILDWNASRPDQTPTVASMTIGYQPNIANTPASTSEIEIDAQWAQQITSAQWKQPLGPYVFKVMVTPLAADNPVAASVLGIKKAHQVMLQTYITLLRLFQRTVPASQMRGPLGIADAGTSFAKQGWPYLMFFLGLISVNLVVINFLPIPIVDGGLMVFLIIEKLKGSPVSVRIQTAATIVGLAMIGSVLLFTLFYDAKRLFEM